MSVTFTRDQAAGFERSVTGRREAFNFDFTTFFSIILLTCAGFVAIYSATYAAQMNDRFTPQIWFAVAGLSIAMVISFLPVRWLSLIAYPSYFISLGLLVAVMLIGKEVYGQKNWLVLGGFQFQPSELAKLATILAAGRFLGSKDRDMTKIVNLLAVVAIYMLPCGFILLEPDFGSAVIFVGMLFITLLWAGADLFMLVSIALPGAAAVFSLFGPTPELVSVLVAGVILFFIFRRNLILTGVIYGIVILTSFSTNLIYDRLPKHHKDRIQVMMDPSLDPLGIGYNVIQTKMAIGSGGLLGKGFLKGTQTQLRYVPKQWTDFIISVPAEEFGIIGILVILMLYCFVVVRGVAIASSVRSKFSSVVALGIASVWFLHITINIGMSLGLLPVIGIPLPFMSYGGSALLTNLLMAGILMNLYRNRKLLF